MWRRILHTPELIWTRLLGFWIKPDILPVDAGAMASAQSPVCFVLESGGVIDRIALTLACKTAGLPSPLLGLRYADSIESRAVIVLRRSATFPFTRRPQTLPPRLQRLVSAAIKADNPPLLLVPVAIYWGRSPDHEDSVFSLMFSEQWEVGGRTRKLIKSLIHGRNTLVQFSEPMIFDTLTRESRTAERTSRKIARILRVHFRNRRIETLGPDLSHRRTLLDRVLQSPSVRNQIADSAAGDEARAHSEWRTARRYANEIAANVSYPTVRVLRKLLSRLWDRLYDGVVLDGIDRLNTVESGASVVYVPSHRSHIDYLLLSYILYGEGKSLPHIAAGRNLDLPVIGSILRRGGAFFLRRSFRDNPLYAAVFNAYMQEMVKRGHALEYFVEGGRSRTGRLLKAKAGMLLMTAHAYLLNRQRSLVFVPVYFGYEKLVEGRAFDSELSGGKKQKESLLGLMRSLRVLQQRFGSVYVSFGRPIEFATILDQVVPDWRDRPVSAARPEWLYPVVSELGQAIQTGVNSSASVSPISLVALAVQTTPRGRIDADDLAGLLGFLRQQLTDVNYHQDISICSLSGPEIMHYGVALEYLQIQTSEFGDLVTVIERRSVQLSYFRNNIIHLYILPGLLACCFLNRRSVAPQEINEIAELLFPYLRNELFLHRDRESWLEEVHRTAEWFIANHYLQKDSASGRLSLVDSHRRESFYMLSLAKVALPAVQRYYLTLALLLRHGSGGVDAQGLRQQCRACAERLEHIHGQSSPEFYDSSLFQGFIEMLDEEGVVKQNSAGNLEFVQSAKVLAERLTPLLGYELRHSIDNIAARPLSR